MWLSKMMTSNDVEEKAENGSVTLSSNNTIETNSSIRVREITSYSPYGYASVPPVGEEVMLIPSADGQAIVGTKIKATKLQSGEILITSSGGASIALKNDGSVVINSVVITKEGEILNDK